MLKSAFHKIRKHPYLTSAITLGILVFLIVLVARSGDAPSQRMVTVTRGTIVQEVTVTGKTKPKETIDLGFEKSGTVAAVHADVGARLTRGAVLVSLDTRELRATLDQATANKAAAIAKLEALRRGPREEDVQIARTAVEKAEQDLANIRSGVPDILQSAYSKSDDAVRKQLDPLFVNDDRTNASLSFETNSVQVTTDAATLRIVAGTELAAWNNELGGITPSTPGATLENMLLAGRAHLTAVRALLDKAMEAVIGGASSLDASTAVTYKSYVTTSRTNVNAALTSMNEELESIAAQKITVSQAKDQLNLKLAGSDPQDILAQEATVAQMDAAARAAEVQLQKSVLRSPIDGILTRQDAKAGALATANQSVASVISSGALQIEANIAEVDIAKISVGDPATVTLDAYGSEVHFDAVVTSIDPAEILIEGIATYKAKFQFAKDDNRILPGMTANIEIQTERRENALLIPQRAVASRNGKKLVWVAGENGEFREQEVMIGFRGSDGNIEVLQGLEEGTRIAAIPPKE